MSEQMPASLSGKRILLIDDDARRAHRAKGLLEKAGALVIGPKGHLKSETIILAREGNVDAIVLSPTVHGGLAWAVADAVSHSWTPIIALADEDLETPATNSDHAMHERKGVARSRLVEALRLRLAAAAST